MEIREANEKDVEGLMELYMKHLTNYPPKEEQKEEEWGKLITEIKNNNDYHLIVGIVNGKIVCSVTLIVIRNLTHNLRPYSVMENVVTHAEYRNKGYASTLIEYASEISYKEKCYKIMLMTGSKKESTLNFYKQNGFSSDEKTAFIKRI